MAWNAITYAVLLLPPAALLLMLSKRPKRSGITFEEQRQKRLAVVYARTDASTSTRTSHCPVKSVDGRQQSPRCISSGTRCSPRLRVPWLRGGVAVVALCAFLLLNAVGALRPAVHMGTVEQAPHRQTAESYLSGKIVWVTGASSGLGEQLAITAARGGAAGVILSGRRQDALERVRQACEAAWPAGVGSGERREGGARVLAFDMGELDGLEEKARKAVSEFGRVDVLALNAGVSTRASVEDTSLEVAQRVMAVNYFGAVALAKGLLTAQAREPGSSAGVHFVVVNSVQGKFGIAFRSSYAASKHALVGFFDCLRAETAHLGVRVTTVLPGYIRTSLSMNALSGDGSRHAQMDKSTATGRDPREVASAVWMAVAEGRDEVVIADLKVKVAVLLRALAPQMLFGLMAKRALKSGDS